MTHFYDRTFQPSLAECRLPARPGAGRARHGAAASRTLTLERLMLLFTAMLCLMAGSLRTWAQDAPGQTEQPAAAQVEAPDAAAEDDDMDEVEAAAEEDDSARPRHRHRHRHGHGDSVILHFGDDSHLAAGATANSVAAIFGSASSAGKVDDTVLSIFGNTRVEGPVGQDAVAVFGNTYVNSSVGQDAVAVFGNLELGPEAEVGGDAVSIGGKVIRDPGATVHGDIQEMSVGERFGGFAGLHTWINQCLLYGRPLAFERELGWAWLIALGFLALYIIIALLFGRSVERCVETLETHPGQSAVASLLTLVLTPLLMVLLIASVIGILLVPFAGIILFCATVFGKAVVLAALGRRVTHFTGVGAFSHVAFATLIGGLIILGLYVVPVLGFIVYKLLGIFGLGVVVYTVLLALRQRQSERAQLHAAPTAAAAGTESAAAPTGAEAAGAATMSAAGTPGTAEPAAAQPSASEPAATVAAVTALPRAGFWIRMGALLIDFVLIGILISVLDPPGKLMLLTLAGYGAVMWKLKGTTIGGIVFGLKVVRRDGQPLGWDTAIVRALSCFLSLMVAGLGFLWIVFDADRQGWHDKIAGTLVVRAPKGEALL